MHNIIEDVQNKAMPNQGKEKCHFHPYCLICPYLTPYSGKYKQSQNAIIINIFSAMAVQTLF
jgi:hypothetical protein